MTYRLSTDTRNMATNAIVDDIDAGAGAGTCAIRTGTQPATVDAADTGTLLGTCVFTDPAFGNAGAVTAGLATASAIASDTSADASGTAGHFRIKDSSANIHSDGTCGQGTGDLSFDSNVIVIGGTISIGSMTISIPIS